MPAVPIITNVSSNPTHGEMYSMAFHVIKFERLQEDRWFSPVSSTNKTERYDICEILLKLALNATYLYQIRNISTYEIHKKAFW
jgi:hypothetical protein